MTEKADKIMKWIREMDQKKRLALLNDPSHRARLMAGVNRLNQDEPARVSGGDQEMKILKGMNELQDFENENWSRGSV